MTGTCKTRGRLHVRQQVKETLCERLVRRVGRERVEEACECVQAVLHLGPVVSASTVGAVGERAVLLLDGEQGAVGDWAACTVVREKERVEREWVGGGGRARRG